VEAGRLSPPDETSPGEPTRPPVRRRVVVHGRVQGVGFRASCTRRAVTLGLGGWVRNRADGTVEAVFEGDEPAVAGMVAWCSGGPPLARVEHVEVVDEDAVGERGFSAR